MKILVCDMDGTLVDSKSNITAAVNYVRREINGKDAISEEEVVAFLNGKTDDAARLFGAEGSLERERRLFREYYLEICTDNLSFFDGMRETLEELKGMGVALAIATNASTIFAKKMMQGLDALHLFEKIVGADSVTRPKPSPDMVESIMAALGAGSSECRVIGDSIKDMRAAKAAGAEAIFAGWGYSDAECADMVLYSPSELTGSLSWE
jgi:phosphoglycolate phosphatase